MSPPPTVLPTRSPTPITAAPHAGHVDTVPHISPAERLLVGYLALTGTAALFFGRPLRGWLPIVGLHLLVSLAIMLVPPRLPARRWAEVLRDFFPVVAIPLLYSGLRKLNHLFTDAFFDERLRTLELIVFPSDPSRTLHLLLPWKPLGEFLMIAYFSYYALLPILALTLYLRREYTAFRWATTSVLSVYLFCFVCFIIFPVQGPFFIFERPDPQRIGWLFPRFAQAVVGWGTSLGATFPSSHVAAAMVMWLLARRLGRRVFIAYSIIVPALILGTVYGGFHYAIDAVVGIVVGVVGYWIAPSLWRWLGGDPSAIPAAGYRT